MSGNANQIILLGDQDIVYPHRIGNMYSSATFLPADGTTAKTICTGAPGYYICQIGYQIDETATTAGGAMVALTFTDDQSGIMSSFRFYLPNSAGNPTNAATVREINPGPFVWSSKIANSNLNVALTAALTAGSVRAFIRWGRTQYLG